ncbi:hypothetical protein C5S32_00600 [ANME-1 cluster archaeon GoMg1]|nr:hypothetical protein [ANME-1 cluster archaeon GoMg1]
MKTTKLMGVVAIAMALMIVFSGAVVASRPACTTPETQTINTVIQVSCRGMVTEKESVNWESSNEDLLNSPPLQDREVIGRIDYTASVKVTDGETRFVKDTGVDTGSDPNLDVMTSMGYTQGMSIGALSFDEDAGMGIVSNWANTSAVIPCQFATRATGNKLPASSEDVSAGSSLLVTDVLATTRAKVGITEAPVGLHYEVTATGSGVLPEIDSDGTPLAHGRIAAEFSVSALEGSAENGNVSESTLGSRLTYYKRSTAIGLWQFHAGMDYESRIRP